MNCAPDFIWYAIAGILWAIVVFIVIAAIKHWFHGY